MRRPMPRDAGGSIEITEGTGPIRAMISTGEILEIYKADKTFRVATPETIDPERTNPNAPFTVSTVQNVGTSNRIVARVLLQSREILNLFLATQDKLTAILKQLHQCKESLLRAESSGGVVSSKIRAIEEKMKLAGVNLAEPLTLKSGRVLKPFPHVENLEAECSNFLVEINRAIRAVSGLPSLFIPLEKADSNFDHLGKRLAEKLGEDELIMQFVKAVTGDIRHFVDMRNFLEHPNSKRTVINNFQLLPDGTLCPPTWHLSGEKPVHIGNDMAAIVDFLIQVAEELLIHLVIYSGKDRLNFNVQEIPEGQMDPDFPVKYKVEAYLKQFHKPSQPAP